SVTCYDIISCSSSYVPKRYKMLYISTQSFHLSINDALPISIDAFCQQIIQGLKCHVISLCLCAPIAHEKLYEALSKTIPTQPAKAGRYSSFQAHRNITSRFYNAAATCAVVRTSWEV